MTTVAVTKEQPFKPCSKGTEAQFYYQECLPCKPGKFDVDEARYEREILPGVDEYPIVCDACDIGQYQESYGAIACLPCLKVRLR